MKGRERQGSRESKGKKKTLGAGSHKKKLSARRGARSPSPKKQKQEEPKNVALPAPMGARFRRALLGPEAVSDVVPSLQCRNGTAEPRALE